MEPRTAGRSNGKRAGGSARRTIGRSANASASRSGPRSTGVPTECANRGLRPDATCKMPSSSRTAAPQEVGQWTSTPFWRAIPPSRIVSVSICQSVATGSAQTPGYDAEVTVEWDWTRVVFDHVKITVSDAGASLRFYKAVLAPLGIPPLWESDRAAQFANLVVSAGAEPSGPIHAAFVADSREQVDAFHRAGIEAGFRDNGPPGVREQYSSEDAGVYYAAFLLDPDGNNIEAVRREF